MKALKIIITLIFILSLGQVFGQSSKTLSAALPNYYKALNSNNSGMVESAIVNLIKLKMYAPDLDYQDTIKKMNELTENGQTDIIKYKAFIGQLYLENPERFNWISDQDMGERFVKIDTMFDRIEEQLSHK